MRNIAYGTAVLTSILLVAIAVGHLPRTATASHDQTSETMDILKLEGTTDMKTMPQQKIPPEVYQ